jgi:hypothetical protein
MRHGTSRRNPLVEDPGGVGAGNLSRRHAIDKAPMRRDWPNRTDVPTWPAVARDPPGIGWSTNSNKSNAKIPEVCLTITGGRQEGRTLGRRPSDGNVLAERQSNNPTASYPLFRCGVRRGNKDATSAASSLRGCRWGELSVPDCYPNDRSNGLVKLGRTACDSPVPIAPARLSFSLWLHSPSFRRNSLC